jgi:hypothetical protein
VPFDRALTGYSTYREELKRVRAFGDPDGCVVRVSHDDTGLVTGVDFQLTVRDDREADLLARTLAAWAARHPLLLTDWWRKELVDLTDPGRVNEYVASLRLG